MRRGQLILSIMNINLFIISLLLINNGFIDTGLLIIIISSLFLILLTKIITGHYTSMSVLFVGFSFLYGLAGPVNIVWGEGLHRIFANPYHVSSFITSYSLACIGLIFGFIVYNTMKKSSKIAPMDGEIDLINILICKRQKIYLLSLSLAIIASVFELFNLYRVGGIALLFQGKALYQSLTTELSLTLPSTEIVIVAFSLFGMYLSIFNTNTFNKNALKSKIVLFSLASLPYLFMKLILGQRGILASLFLCIFLGITYFKPIKRIKPKLIVIILIFYVFLSFIYANRAIVSLITENPGVFIEMAFKKERLVDALNPGTSEFGTAYGNYSEFYNKYGINFSPKLGSTYIKGLVIPIPSFLYPGSKPIQIAYEFRNEFFVSEASRGSIAGTGFSSILEAYINFNYLGPFLIYFLIGYYLQKIDKKYRYKSLFTMALYLSSLALTVSFHRSSFGYIFGSVLLRSLVIIFALQSLKIKSKFKKISSSHINSAIMTNKYQLFISSKWIGNTEMRDKCND